MKNPQACANQDWFEKIAEASSYILSFCEWCKENTYLSRVKIPAIGVYNLTSDIVINFHERCAVDVVVLPNYLTISADEAYTSPINNKEFLHIRKGSLIVPMADSEKRTWNLQIISADGDSITLPFGKVGGLFHFAGDYSRSDTVAVTIDYASAGVVAQSTDWSVSIAFTPENLKEVAQILKRQLPDHDFVISVNSRYEAIGVEVADSIDGALTLIGMNKS